MLIKPNVPRSRHNDGQETDSIVESIVSISQSPPADAFTESHARLRLLDAAVCGAIGVHSPQAVMVAEWAQADGGGASRSWRHGGWGRPECVGFANGVAIRAHDLNDTYRLLDGVHPSDAIGVLVAGAEKESTDLGALLHAIAIAYEVQGAFADTWNLTSFGWDQGVSGGIAAAAGSSAILGLSPDQLAHAVGLAATSNLPRNQTRMPPIAGWKACAAAWSASQGYAMARLAGLGIEGPALPFEGVAGWFEALNVVGPLMIGHSKIPAVARTNVKRWPVRDSCQLPVDAAVEIHHAIKETDMIKSIEVAVYESVYQGAAADPAYWYPTTMETADHSLPYCVVAAILDGGISIRSLQAGRYLDADVSALLPKLSVTIDDSFTRLAPGQRNCRINVQLTNGRSVAAEMSTSGEAPGAEHVLATIEHKVEAAARLGLLDRRAVEDLSTLLLSGLQSVSTSEVVDAIRACVSGPSEKKRGTQRALHEGDRG